LALERLADLLVVALGVDPYLIGGRAVAALALRAGARSAVAGCGCRWPLALLVLEIDGLADLGGHERVEEAV
jgi:hypothetical protein